MRLDVANSVPSRALRRTPFSAECAWMADGSVANPGDVTCTVTRANGTVLLEDEPAVGSGTARSVDFTAAQMSELDSLTLLWASDTLGTLETRVEVVGGFMFTLTGARGLAPLSNTSTYPDASVIAARTLAEMALEEACGVAFVPRYAREVLSGKGTTKLFTRSSEPVRVISATVDGTALSAPQIAALQVDRKGFVWNEDGWSAGDRNIVIEYEHGHPTPPANGPRAALLLAKRYLVDSPVNDRATTLINQDGTTQYLVTAGVKGAVFDIPEVNAFVASFQETSFLVA